MLATGCGGGKYQHYSLAEVRSTFAAHGMRLYDRDQVFERDDRSPAEERDPRPTAQPLRTLLNGIRSAFVVSSMSDSPKQTTLRSPGILVFVYPREEQARDKARNLADILGAQEILHQVQFAYAQKGNVVVSFRRYRNPNTLPGFRAMGDAATFGDLRMFNRDLRRQVTAALGDLG